jgi:hypothetical protein
MTPCRGEDARGVVFGFLGLEICSDFRLLEYNLSYEGEKAAYSKVRLAGFRDNCGC